LTTQRPIIRKPASTVRRILPTTQKIPTTSTTTTVNPVVQVQSNNNPKSIQTSSNIHINTHDKDNIVSNTVYTSEKTTVISPKLPSTDQSTSAYSLEDDAKFLSALLHIARNADGKI
jgi:hypothetical protein